MRAPRTVSELGLGRVARAAAQRTELGRPTETVQLCASGGSFGRGRNWRLASSSSSSCFGAGLVSNAGSVGQVARSTRSEIHGDSDFGAAAAAANSRESSTTTTTTAGRLIRRRPPPQLLEQTASGGAPAYKIGLCASGDDEVGRTGLAVVVGSLAACLRECHCCRRSYSPVQMTQLVFTEPHTRSFSLPASGFILYKPRRATLAAYANGSRGRPYSVPCVCLPVRPSVCVSVCQFE